MRLRTLIALSILTACSGGAEDKAQLPQTHAATGPVEVATTRVGRSAIALPVVASGATEALRIADLGPQLTAQISAVLVEEGAHVEEGQPLVRLDMRDASLRAAQAVAGAASANVQAQLAESEYQRLAPLAQRGTIPTRQADQLQAQRDALAGAARAADAMAAQARRGVTESVLRAPFAGTVSAVLAEVGEVATMMPPTVLVRLVDLSQLEVSVRVHERDLARIVVGDAVEVSLPNSGRTVSGHVTFISPEIDARSRTATVTTRIPNPDGTLRAGSFAELRIRPSQQRLGLVVSREAVAGSGEDSAVFVVQNGKVARRAVRVQTIDDRTVEVLEGLRDGETIAVGRLDRLADGVEIRAATANARSER